MEKAYSGDSGDYVRRFDSEIANESLSDFTDQIKAAGAIHAYDDLYGEQDLKKYTFKKNMRVISKILKPGESGNITNKSHSRQKMFYKDHIDFLVQENETNDVYIFQNVFSAKVDHNTRHHALLLAAIGEKLLNNNHEIKGVIFNCIRKPKIQKRTVETITEFSGRVAKFCSEKNRSAEGVSDTIFYRERMKFSSEQKIEILQDLWDASGEMQDLVGKMRNERSEKKQSLFYKNLNCCNRNFERCKFYDQCEI
jgi:hypothetical protein